MNTSDLFAENQPPARLVLIFVALLFGFFGFAFYLAGQVSSGLYVHNTELADGVAVDRRFSSEGVVFREVSTTTPRMSIRILHHESSSTPSASSVPKLGELLEAIRAYKLSQSESSLFPMAILKYFSAHFDSRRARPQEAFTWGDETGRYDFQHLLGKNSRPLALGIHQAGSNVHFILVSTAEEKVPESALKSKLHVLMNGGS